MKKTLSISLGGRVFQIEEDGFQTLESYLASLKQRFSTDQSADELLTDIETSLGEKFTDRLALSHALVVTNEDVQAVIRVMGNVEEIAGEEGEAQVAHGAVSEETENPKKLYRDQDDRVVAGVCAGLAAYVGARPLTIRILFLVLMLLHGFGVLLYLILWIVLPVAKTNDQKLEMRGKPVTIDTLERLVKEKAEKIRGEAAKPDSVFLRLLNLPIVLIAAIARAIRGFFAALGPILSILVGIGILLGTLFGITAATVTTSMLIFPTRSGFLVSDLPLKELTSQPLYGAGIASGYLLALIPLLFLLILAVTLIRRRNAFRLIPTAVLIGIWIMAASVGALALREIGPWAYERTEELKREATVTQAYSEAGFRGVQTSGSVRAEVKRGDTFSIQLTGLKNDLAGVVVTQDQGILRIKEDGRNSDRCLFCFHRDIEAVITLPELTSYEATDASHAHIEGFSQDLDLRVNDAARVELALLSQSVTSTIRDVGRLTILGTAKHLTITASDASHVDAQSVQVRTAMVITEDVASVIVSPKDQLVATSKDVSRIEFEAEPTTTTLRELGNSRIRGPLSEND